jgi:hypothetical protein
MLAHAKFAGALRRHARRRAAMANKEHRSNREKRKPKKEKPKPAPTISVTGRKS